MKRLSAARIAGTTAVLLGIWFAAASISLCVGSVRIEPGRAAGLLWDYMLSGAQESSPEGAILLAVRLPRILLGSVVGAALAIAGAAFQSLLRNPLADPYVLGVSTGASTGTILHSIAAAAAGWQAASLPWERPAAAFAGAALTVGAVLLVAGRRDAGGDGSHRLLLAGIILASFISSINVFLLTSTREADLRGIIYWLIGDLSRPVDATLRPVALAVFLGSIVLFLLSRSLTLMATGEQDALILGVEVRRVKLATYLTGSLVTGAVVSVSGPIAYIGLICPHMVRMLFGNDNRLLFPAVFVFGAVFSVAADTVARTVISPAELPVGVVTALCGAPLFIYLLRRKRGGQ